MTVPYLSIISACYNESPHLKWSVEEIIRVMNHTSHSYELIFIDDCSQDDTRRIIQELIDKYSHDHNMQLLFHEKNTGRGGAVNDGIKLAKGTIVGFLDVDLVIHPHYIPAMVWAIEDGYDIATALRIYPLKIGQNIFRHVLT
jgi:dolichol-phosphate mannosyltransferase